MGFNLTYRKPEYFNGDDVFIGYDIALRKLFLTKMHLDRGIWWTNHGLKYQGTTIYMQNFNEIYGMEISLKGVDYKGIIWKTHCVDKGNESSFGIGWYSGKQIKEHGLMSFWCKLDLLEINI